MQDPKKLFAYEEIEDGYCKLTEDYLGVCTTPRHGKQRRYVIHINEGFVFRVSFPFDALEHVFSEEKMREATLVHDMCYRYEGRLLPAGGILLEDYGGFFDYKTDVSRAFADRLFYELLELDPFRAWIAYKAVSWFGTKEWEDPYVPHPKDTSTHVSTPPSLIMDL